MPRSLPRFAMSWIGVITASTVVFSSVLVGAVAAPAAGNPSTEQSLKPVGSRNADQQRKESSPTLTTALAQPPKRTAVPADRYAMAGGCYAMSTADGQVLVKTGGAYSLATGAAPAPIHFQATELGRYLLWDADQQFISLGGSPAADPSEDTEWTVDGKSDAFTIKEGLLGVSDGWKFRQTTGCPEWPDVELNVTGAPFAGVSSIQEVRGYADDHTHQMATDFLGGGIHCGRPWHRYGVTYALKDCADHETTKGYLAIPEIILSGNTDHDPVGWPTFKDWPAPGSLTHEGVYYKWLERSWRGGQRIFVNLLVENEILCVIYPNLTNPTANIPGVTKTCNDMEQVRHQAKLIREMQGYIDAQWGGPGKGWFRIVDTPEDARRIINEGKLAVILGTETSDIFNCSKLGAIRDILPAPGGCTDADLDEGLDELYDLGVRQMVITHKFDNAFGGAKGDDGFNGVATNVGTFLQNGSFFRMKPCAEGQAPDNKQLGSDELAESAPEQFAQLTALLGLIGSGFVSLPLPIALPLLYAPGDQCNSVGLTDLGESMIRKMAERHIIVDVDHFNSKTRAQALDVLDDLKYSGVISSHSWADNNAIPRIYQRGGFVAPYAGGSGGFANTWEGLTKVMDGRFYWGVGYGADTNGLGAQGGPRNPADNPVTYPFTTFADVTVDQQRSGERVYNINTDGVSHYGLYPDWMHDLTKIKGPDIQTDMFRGSEAYLGMWERATGITNDACRQPELRRQAKDFAALNKGMSATEVLHAVGQPHLRRAETYKYCALNGSKDATVTVAFAGGTVKEVDTGLPTANPKPGANKGNDKDGKDKSVSEGSDDLNGNGSGGATQASDAMPDTGGPGLSQLLAGLLALLLGAVLVTNTRRFTLRGGHPG